MFGLPQEPGFFWAYLVIIVAILFWCFHMLWIPFHLRKIRKISEKIENSLHDIQLDIAAIKYDIENKKQK